MSGKRIKPRQASQMRVPKKSWEKERPEKGGKNPRRPKGDFDMYEDVQQTRR